MQTTTYKLNITPGGVPLTIHISQYDVGLRQYIFQPYTSEGEFTYVSGATVTLEATKPDGYAVIHNCTYNQNGSIAYTVQEQLAAKAGRVWSKVVIRNGNNVLGTGAVLWIVDYAGVKDNAIISDSDISGLEGYVDQMKTLVGTPIAVTTAAGMTDHEKLYLYEGSESGYTAGDWYYWDGSAWTSGGEYGSGAVEIDPTLSIAGDAADAKATGDEITELKNELNYVTEHINLLPITSGSATVLEVETTYNNGHYTCIGTSTGDGGRLVHLIEFTLPAGTYTVSAHNTVISGEEPVIFCQNASNTILAHFYKGTIYTFTLNATTTLNVSSNLANGKTYNFTCDLQINSGSSTAEYFPPSGTAVDTIARKLIPTVSELDESITDLDIRVTDIENGSQTITPSWTQNYYVNNVSHGLSALTGYYYSELITLKRGEGIQIIDAYATDTSIIDMLSRWTFNGVYEASIYPFATTGYSNSTLYRATSTEYIRVCSKHDPNQSTDKIRVVKYDADLSGAIEDIQNLAIIPSISMFERVGFCGDSYVKGQIYNASSVAGDFPNLSWGANIGRTEGITAEIYASSGADTNTWQTRSDCLPALLADEECGLYVFCLGINDTSYVTLGSITDITGHSSYADYPNTFYGNYGKIIEQVLAYSPNSKIILMTPYHPSFDYRYVTPLTEISTDYGIAMINVQNSKLCHSDDFTSRLVAGHPTSVLYSAMGRDISNLIGECMDEYYTYFKDYTGV